MNDYIKALKALHHLLEVTGVEHWKNWISKDIELAKEGVVDHHLKIYGGMGSFNDVIICKFNGHNVLEEQEPWVDILFQTLKGFCFWLAKSDSKMLTENIEEKVFWKAPKNIQGRMCKSCGYAQLSTRDIDTFIAPEIIRELYKSEGGFNNIVHFIDIVISDIGKFKVDDFNYIKSLAIKSNIVVYNGNTNDMRSCSKCAGNNLAVYRWEIASTIFNRKKLKPARDNIKMKMK